MKLPIKPCKPIKPNKPEFKKPSDKENLFICNIVDEYDSSIDESISFKEILDKTKMDNISYEDIFIDISMRCHDYDDGFAKLEVSAYQLIPMPEDRYKIIYDKALKSFESEMKRFEKELVTYDKKLEKYKKDVKEYNQKMTEYIEYIKTPVVTQASPSQIKRLKKELIKEEE
jgi:hypothetical protein